MTISSCILASLTKVSADIQLNHEASNNEGCMYDHPNYVNDYDTKRISEDNSNTKLDTPVNHNEPSVSTATDIPSTECVFDNLKKLRITNPQKVIISHLNINSIPNKFQGIMDLVANNVDIFLISETKIDNPFPTDQFCYHGYTAPHRKDRALGGGGLMLFVNEDIPSKLLTGHTLPENVEILCTEINLKKQKWVIIGIYNPPGMNNKYFMDNLSKTIDLYSTKYDRIVVMGDFNLEPSSVHIEALPLQSGK